VKAIQATSPLSWSMLLRGLSRTTVLTTLTDLGTAAFPKAKAKAGAGARYVYAFHSPVSTHVAYPEGAFDHYDVIFCAGPDHVAEIRARERLLKIPAKTLCEIGYPHLDALAQQWRQSGASDQRTATIAPSWVDDEMFQTVWLAAAQVLCSGGWKVVLRPHPETIKRSPTLICEIEAQCAEDAGLRLDLSADAGERMAAADVLISDWSGAAIEFGVASGRPVVFIDTPQKVRNPNWRAISANSSEARIRHELGVVVAVAELGELNEIVGSLVARSKEPKPPAHLFNFGSSSKAAAEALTQVVRDVSA
jgi:YidC/Oxa1 family membrane protein insertase